MRFTQSLETLACWFEHSSARGDDNAHTKRALLTLIQDTLLCEHSANFVPLQHLALLQCLHSISAEQIAEA